eukprot:749405-Hanusia_phi.AAC.1
MPQVPDLEGRGESEEEEEEEEEEVTWLNQRGRNVEELRGQAQLLPQQLLPRLPHVSRSSSTSSSAHEAAATGVRKQRTSSSRPSR